MKILKCLVQGCAIAGIGVVPASLLAGEEVRIDPPSTPNHPGWLLRLPKGEKVIFQGWASFDDTRAGGPILYQVPNAAGLVVAVLTHGALISGQQAGQKSKLQEEADKVLAPYQEVLNDFTQKDLMERASKRMKTAGNKQILPPDAAGTGKYINTSPVFIMTQDQTALLLYNIISISQDGNILYQNTVRVNSRPATASDLTAFWKDKNGELLRDTSASLLADSLDLAVDDSMRGPVTTPEKTHRYLEGVSRRVERAQLIRRLCDRIVLRTLRGWVMSVPVPSSTESASSAPSCS